MKISFYKLSTYPEKQNTGNPTTLFSIIRKFMVNFFKEKKMLTRVNSKKRKKKISD